MCVYIHAYVWIGVPRIDGVRDSVVTKCIIFRISRPFSGRHGVYKGLLVDFGAPSADCASMVRLVWNAHSASHPVTLADNEFWRDIPIDSEP